METNFISPLPWPPRGATMSESCELGPFNLAECVFFFWNLQKIVYSMDSDIVLATDDTLEVLEESHIHETISTPGSDSILYMPSQERALSNQFMPFASLAGKDLSLLLNGPFYARAYSDSTPFEERQFLYYITPQVSRGIAALTTLPCYSDEVVNVGTFRITYMGHTANYYAYLDAKYFRPHYAASVSVISSITLDFSS